MSTRNVHGLQVRVDHERYLSRVELAAIMGVSVRTIDRMVREGAPSETWGLSTRRFLASRTLAWARERERERGAA